MTDDRTNDAIDALLRQGDPAADESEPSREDIAQMRRTVLNALPERRKRIRWFPVAAATAALAMAVVLITPARLDRQAADTPLPTAGTETVDSGTATADAGSRRQQVQFATEKGTRIIWVLDPDLNL
jgi:hypothetical protein